MTRDSHSRSVGDSPVQDPETSEIPRRIGAPPTVCDSRYDVVGEKDRVPAAQELLLAWYDRNRRDLPWRRTRDPYAILVSEVMLQQTQVDRVAPKYEQFLERFPTLTALAAASPAEVIRIWAPLGYNRRAVNLYRLAREAVARHGGALPGDLKALRALPGVGRYSAAAVACFAFGLPEATVETNVRRVLTRLEGVDAGSEPAIERLAGAYLARERASDWNQALMDLGATLCRAASPLCLLCPLRAVCRSSGGVVREARGGYRATQPDQFAGSNRHLRGRIIDVLRQVDSMPARELATHLSLEGENGEARLHDILQGLERDGLVAADEGAVRLPS